MITGACASPFRSRASRSSCSPAPACSARAPAPQLDGYRLAQPLAEVWPAALRLLDERGYDLASEDRVTTASAAQRRGALLSQARDTRSTKDGRWVAETDLDASDVRYRIEGTDTGGGTSRVTFFRVAGSLDGRDDREHRDVELELELVRRVDPAGAVRVSDAAAR
jgi:hypothetical protein